MSKILILFFLFIPLIGLGQRIDNNASFRNMEGNKYLRISYDNDYFTATDRYYTQGINFELGAPVLKKNPLTKILICLKNSKNKYGFALDHFGFTPTSIRRDTIIKEDRPFAGIIMLKSSIISIDTVHHSILSSSFSLGAIGSAAGGQQMQSAIHRWIGNIQPLGWQYQIKNDIAINYDLNHEKKIFYNNFLTLNTDAQLRIGTINNKLGLGFNFKIGKFNSLFKYSSNKKFQLYFFNQSLINFVAYDASLQGGLFNHSSPYVINSSNISRTTFQDYFGGVMTFKKLYLEYFQAILSKEFKTGSLHRWGGIKIGIVF